MEKPNGTTHTVEQNMLDFVMFHKTQYTKVRHMLVKNKNTKLKSQNLQGILSLRLLNPVWLGQRLLSKCLPTIHIGAQMHSSAGGLSS